jgi:hypothetical protein
MRNRANVSRLLEAGYQRIPLTAQRPADGARAKSSAMVTTSAGGLPAELRSTLVEVPLLPTEIISVTAAAVANSNQPYAINLTCTLPDEKQQIGGAELFVRGERIVIMPTFTPATSAPPTRPLEFVVGLTIPAGALKPGTYEVTLVGERSSRSWPLEVK